uniref:POP1 C-terminal domain-containing protein n=1 Tax=Oryza nivara TaxID=4536 RepID=A0A0E0HPQ2_ORYNI
MSSRIPTRANLTLAALLILLTVAATTVPLASAKCTVKNKPEGKAEKPGGTDAGLGLAAAHISPEKNAGCVITALVYKKKKLSKHSVATALSESLPVNSNSGDAESSQIDAPTSFQLLVPRTIHMLRHHVKEFHEKYLGSSVMEAVTDKSSLVSGDNVKTGCSVNRLCLVWVLIRAFKEGSFEEGAVVCAPLPSDLSAWNRKTSSGRDAVAIAFCEAKLLAVLRRQQWTHENLKRKDICVLVRNARSAAY